MTDSVVVTPGPAGNVRRVVVALAVVLAIAAGLYYLDTGREQAGPSTAVNLAGATGPAPKVGSPAPDFQAASLSGATVRLSDFRGKPVWLNFWASWCPPCRAETPDVEATYEARKGEGLVLLAVSINEEAAPVKSYVEASGITFTVGLDPSTRIAGRYRINGLPTHFFIDRDGFIRDMQVGGLSRAAMQKKLAKIMP